MPRKTKDYISAYNKSLTPEQRTESARKAGIASQKKQKENKTIREIARIINASKAPEEAQERLEQLGIADEDRTNAAVIAASVFMAAFNGDMKAVEKWERYVGQTDTTDEDEGQLSALIIGLQRKD